MKLYIHWYITHHSNFMSSSFDQDLVDDHSIDGSDSCNVLVPYTNTTDTSITLQSTPFINGDTFSSVR